MHCDFLIIFLVICFNMHFFSFFCPHKNLNVGIGSETCGGGGGGEGVVLLILFIIIIVCGFIYTLVGCTSCHNI